MRRIDPEAYREKLAYLLASPNITQYRKRRRETGIVKPSIFAGLQPRHMSPVPLCFVLDLMHLIALNLAELLLPLWRGQLYTRRPDNHALWEWVTLKDETWTQHGADVASCTPYLPGSFDRPPRNPAEKINSGYKAWEFLLYLYVLGPGVFRAVLEEKYWRHHCRLVFAVRVLLQRTITRKQLEEAHNQIIKYCVEFEEIYYKRIPERLHFVRQSIHTLIHIAPETMRVGPGCLYTQWTLERVIGDLGAEIRQPSQPYKNLSQRATRRAQVNALKAMIPDLDPEPAAPRGSQDIGDGYHLLTAHDDVKRLISPEETKALVDYLNKEGEEVGANWQPRISRWARVQLPVGQISRSYWKEGVKPLEKLRIARMVKVSDNV